MSGIWAPSSSHWSPAVLWQLHPCCFTDCSHVFSSHRLQLHLRSSSKPCPAGDSLWQLWFHIYTWLYPNGGSLQWLCPCDMSACATGFFEIKMEAMLPPGFFRSLLSRCLMLSWACLTSCLQLSSEGLMSLVLYLPEVSTLTSSLQLH